MAADSPTIADLTRAPRDVAERLHAWARGDYAEAVGVTLELSGRSLFARAYTLWAWCGRTPEGVTGLLVPVRADDVERFAPAGPMGVLTRCLTALGDCGADLRAIRLIDWDGFTGLVAPGADLALVAIALPDTHPDPAAVAVAELPESVAVDGPPLDLATFPPLGGSGLGELGRATRTHPVPIALELAAHGWRLDEQTYSRHVVDHLRHSGFDGPPPEADAPRYAIRDDPCPRRRHARLVLRRLLHKRKVGAQYHTEFDHLARGAPPDERAAALVIGEALIRAGLLGEKPSVGQRHVYLRREALPQIHALIDRGETSDAGLAANWSCPPP